MSPRPRKHRHCECPFRQQGGMVYKPTSIPMGQLNQVVFPGDEMEAMRLCNYEGLTQEEAGARMRVSRGTVQRLVTSGRKRLIGRCWPVTPWFSAAPKGISKRLCGCGGGDGP